MAQLEWIKLDHSKSDGHLVQTNGICGFIRGIISILAHLRRQGDTRELEHERTGGGLIVGPTGRAWSGHATGHTDPEFAHKVLWTRASMRVSNMSVITEIGSDCHVGLSGEMLFHVRQEALEQNPRRRMNMMLLQLNGRLIKEFLTWLHVHVPQFAHSCPGAHCSLDGDTRECNYRLTRLLLSNQCRLWTIGRDLGGLIAETVEDTQVGNDEVKLGEREDENIGEIGQIQLVRRVNCRNQIRQDLSCEILDQLGCNQR